MKYCQVDGFRYPDTSSHCRDCGNKLVSDSELSDPSRIATSCCPNPECPELVAEPNTVYCRECGKALQAISVELWLNKIVEPAFEKNPVDVLLWPARLFVRAAEMGLEKNEVRNRLDRVITARAGANRTQVDEWMQDAIAILIAGGPDLEYARRQVRKLATDRGIKASFSFQVVEAFLKTSIADAKTREFRYQSPLQQEIMDEVSTNRIHETSNQSSTPDAPSTSRSSGTEQPDRSHEVPTGNFEGTQESKGTVNTDRRGKRKNLKDHLPWLIVFIFLVSFLAWGWTRMDTHLPDPAPTPTPMPTPQMTASPSPSELDRPGMASIAEGEFYMGRDDGEALERPAHPEKVAAFFIDKFEVTRAEYKKCVETLACDPPHGWDNNSFPSGTDKFPVTGVSWDDARKYCTSVNKRLPTEVEWEYAARGTDRRRLYPWGEEWMEGRANTNGKGLSEVGTYKAQTDTDLYDLIGNAWEWTADRYRDYPGKEKLTLNKKLRSGDLRIIRGGYFGSKDHMTATYRGALLTTKEKSSYAETGFRCVQSVN
jgi:formylglycine-generating enzyme required for sulfatase activity